MSRQQKRNLPQRLNSKLVRFQEVENIQEPTLTNPKPILKKEPVQKGSPDKVLDIFNRVQDARQRMQARYGDIAEKVTKSTK